MKKTQLEQMADKIEAVTGGQVTRGVVTPVEVRFELIPPTNASIDLMIPSNALADTLGGAVRLERRGIAVDVIFRRDPEPIPLQSIETGLDRYAISPITATLGITDSGKPLLIRLPAKSVGNVLAPVELIPAILSSLEGRHPRRELAFAPATEARRIVENRERSGDTSVVVLIGLVSDLDTDLMRRGPGAGVYTVASGTDNHLPFGVRITRYSEDCRMIAWTSKGPIRFTPAIVNQIPRRLQKMLE